ncbi:hypothetical protein PDO_3267 [Rhizobium sp. PDO1-076]|nr:hypothetical protein PDO_3267 [Rhizobium sp. PDO1-076]
MHLLISVSTNHLWIVQAADHFVSPATRLQCSAVAVSHLPRGGGAAPHVRDAALPGSNFASQIKRLEPTTHT